MEFFYYFNKDGVKLWTVNKKIGGQRAKAHGSSLYKA